MNNNDNSLRRITDRSGNWFAIRPSDVSAVTDFAEPGRGAIVGFCVAHMSGGVPLVVQLPKDQFLKALGVSGFEETEPPNTGPILRLN